MVTDHIYKKIFQLSPDGIVLIDPKSTLPIEFNTAAHENLGYTREEFAALSISDYEANESKEDIEAHVQNIMKNGRDDFETLHRTKSGELINVLVTVILVELEENKVLLAHFRDLTETKIAQSKADEVHRKLEMISSQIPGVVYQYKLNPDGTSCFPYSSRGMKSIYGVEPHEVEADASAVFKTLHPDDLDRVSSSIKLSAETLEPWKTEYRVLSRDGQEKWLMGSALPMKENDGSVLWHGFITDISEQKVIQEKLASKTKELEGFFNVSLDLLCIADLQGRFIKLNKAWEDVLGYTVQDLEGRQFLDFVHPDDIAGTVKSMSRLKDNSNVLNFVNRYKDKRGNYKYIEWRSHPHGSLIYAAARDITDRIETEKALRLSEQRFRDVSSAAGEYIWETNAGGVYIFATDKICDVLGRPLDKIIGKSPYDFIDKEDGSEVADFFSRKAESRESFSSLEHKIMRPDGSIVWQRVTKVPVFNDEGEFSGYRGAGLDITAEIQARKHLEDNELKFRGLFEMSPIGIGLNDMATGQWLDFNRSLLESTGYNEDEFRKLSYWDLTPKEYEPQEMEQIRQLRETGYFGPYEKEYISKNGQRYPVLLNGMLIKDSSGREMIWCIIQDITERKQFEEAILRSEKQIRTMTQASLDALIMVDSKGTVTFWNLAAEKLFGYSEKEAMGQDVHKLVAGEHEFKKLVSGMQEFAESGRGPVIDNVLEFKARRKDGEWIDVERSVAAFDFDGEWHAVGSLRDISDRIKAREETEKARQAAEAASKSKSEFLANMSHEIRTPMNAVIGLSQLALRTDLNPRQKDYLSKIESSSKMLLGIINDILDYSKIEAGKMDLDEHEFNLDRIIEQVSVLFHESIESKGLEVYFRVMPDVPRILVGDSLRLKQVLTNLMSNAVKFTHEGEIEVRVRVESRHNNRAVLRFEIRDTGIGLSKDEQEKLFLAFSQADTSTTRKYGGTGLGLTISQHLVTMMGGSIQIKSESDKGSVFSFTARLGISEDREYRFDSCDLTECRVLVVDHSSKSRKILKEMFASWGFNFHEAASGQEALQRVKDLANHEKGYDYIVIDWDLPDQSGIQAGRLIRQAEQEFGLGRQPCIILTSFGNKEEVMEQAAGYDLDVFLVKPVTSSALFNVIIGVGYGQNIGTSLESDKARSGLFFKGIRVLLAEDNEINQQVAREILEQAGIEVHVVQNGRQAVQEVKKQSFDLVLMDIQMPEMDGFEATAAIREISSSLPIVAMTAAAMTEDREKSLAAGMNDHLGKPIDQGLLYLTIQKWTGQAAQGDHFTQADSGSTGIQFPDELPGIDVSSGLDRLGGNALLFAKLIHSTVTDYSDLPAKLREYLVSSDTEEAGKLVHALKGVSGNISAKRLFDACKEFEDSMQRGGSATAKIQEVANALEEIASGLELIPIEKLRPLRESSEPVLSEVLENISALKDSLRQHSLEATSIVSFFQENFGYGIYASVVDQLGNSILEFEFKEAEKSLQEFEKLFQQNFQVSRDE